MARPYTDQDDVEAEETAPFIRERESRCRPFTRKPPARLCVLAIALLTLLLPVFILTSFPSSHKWHTVPHASFDAQGNLLTHPKYLVFSLSNKTRPAPTDRPIRGIRRLPSSCIEEHIAYGSSCRDGRPVKFDMVWTWVNGSDPRLEQEMREAVEVQPPPPNHDAAKNPESKLYRDHDELRHSFRSVLTHFRPYIRLFHLFTSDFPFTSDQYTPDTTPNAPRLRLGQLPSWLGTSEQGRWKDGEVALDVVYHSQVFENWEGTSFNSFGIETQLMNLPNVEHNIIYLNDDFYFTRNLKPADFWTPAYGPVLRFDIDFLIDPKRADDGAKPGGEWGPLGTASWLLCNRFGLRSRPYVHHTPKPLPLALLSESAQMWPGDFARTASHRFRGMRAPAAEGDKGGEYDVYVTFLTTHLMVERAREALLWAWVVARVGGVGGEWGVTERRRAWEEVGGRWEKERPEGVVQVTLTERGTVKGERVRTTLEASGVEESKETTYLFSSLDGYPYAYKDPQGETIAPQFSGPSLGQKLCTIEYDTCFGGELKSAEEAFKRIAFERVECGDCVIHALRSSSGRLGLNAFLPPVIAASPVQAWEDTLESESDARIAASFSPPLSSADRAPEPAWSGVDPHLPFVPHWREGDFSLASVRARWGDEVNMRRWVIRLLERYKFVIGQTHALFLMIEDPEGARHALNEMADYEALVCVNDDVKRGFQETDRVIRAWQAGRWPRPAEWERT